MPFFSRSIAPDRRRPWPRSLRNWLALCALCSCVDVLSAAQSDWLPFPMYARDTAHAVHLAALKKRPDGLLEAASRYPRHPGETWSEADSASGWYNYERRLIDCRSGESFSYEEQLLARDGSVIARQAFPPESFARRKAELPLRYAAEKWPSSSEIFLACAAAGDPAFRQRQQKADRQKAAALSYRPDYQGQTDESRQLGQRRSFTLKPEQLESPPPRTADALFERLRRQYRDWLASFLALPELAAVPSPKLPAPGADSLSTIWLKRQPVEISLLGSSGDGAIRFIDHRPERYFIDTIVDQPVKAAEARHVDLEMRVDCLSGQWIATQVLWQDGERRLLVGQRTVVADLLKDLRAQAERGALEVNLREAQLGGLKLLACRAATTECRGRLPPAADEAGEKLDPAAIAGDSPAEVLLALRRLNTEARLNDVPNCRFGKY